MKTSLNQLILFSAFCAIVILTSCNKGEDEGPSEGTVSGQVVAFEDGSSIEGVVVSVFDANSNESAGPSTETNGGGEYSLDLPPGTYYLRLAKLGYQEVPPPGVTAIPFTIVEGETVELNYELIVSSVVDGGAISGTVVEGGEGVSGVLVIASSTDGSEAYTAISDSDGAFTIFNIPAGSFNVKGWLEAYNSENVSTSVTANTTTKDVEVAMTSGAAGSLSGTVKFLATGNKQVDVSLIHPITQHVIPGLSTSTLGSFNLTNIPDGEYLARASYNNDTLVVDPDFIVKFGDPVVTVEGGTATVTQGTASSDVLDFAVTNSVLLDNPTNQPEEIVPVEVSATGLTFTWKPYSSTSDYVVELLDINGNVIWGGFDTSVDPVVKNVTTTETSIAYDGPTLTAGRTYRWKVYASKDQQQTGGWSLISVSEDQMGLIKIIE